MQTLVAQQAPPAAAARVIQNRSDEGGRLSYNFDNAHRHHISRQHHQQPTFLANCIISRRGRCKHTHLNVKLRDEPRTNLLLLKFIIEGGTCSILCHQNLRSMQTWDNILRLHFFIFVFNILFSCSSSSYAHTVYCHVATKLSLFNVCKHTDEAELDWWEQWKV